MVMNLEEADKLLFSALAVVGFCQDDKSSMDQLTTEGLYEASVLCVRAIAAGQLSNESPNLAVSLASRLSQCSDLAELCKKLGLRGDIGYHTFLYGSVKDARSVLTFLVSKLPQKTAQRVTSSRECFMVEFGAMLRHHLAGDTAATDGHQMASEPCVDFIAEPISLNSDRCLMDQLSCRARLVPSILDWIARQKLSLQCSHSCTNSPSSPAPLLSSSVRPALSPAPVTLPLAESHPSAASSQNRMCEQSRERQAVLHAAAAAPPSDSADPAESDDQAVAAMQDHLIQCLERLQRGRTRLAKLQAFCEQLATEHKCLSDQLELTKEELKRSRASLQLLSQPEQAEQLLARASQRHQRHVHQWHERRQQLQQQLCKLQLPRPLDQMSLHQLRTEELSLTQQLHERQSALKQLQQLHSSIGQHLSREFYTGRLTELSASVNQQRRSLLDAVGQTESLRRDIVSSSGRLERLFTHAEQLVFKKAVRCSWSCRVYRALVCLRETSDQLVNTAQLTGTVRQWVQQLQYQIDEERSAGTEQSYQRLSADLAAIIEQNSKLKQQQQQEQQQQ